MTAPALRKKECTMRKLYIAIDPFQQPITLEETPARAFLTFRQIGAWPSHALEVDLDTFRKESKHAHGLIIHPRAGNHSCSWALNPDLENMCKDIFAGETPILEPGLKIVKKPATLVTPRF